MLKSMLTVVAFVYFSIVIADDAHAYIDPGTGSYIFQVLIAVLIGGLFFFKNAFRHMIDFFKGLFSKNNEDS